MAVGRPGRRAALTRRARTTGVLVLLVGALPLLAACGSAAPPTPVPPSPAASPFPDTSFAGGPASARLDAPEPVVWDGGTCERGPADAWLALNIGSPNGSEYFGLVAGQSALTPAATRGAAGGGTLGGDDVVITWRHLGVAANLPRGGLVLELVKDLSIGTFRGRLADGTEVRGTFSC